MKCIMILLLVQAVTLITVAKEYRILSLSNRKPVVNLKKEIIEATRKMPEERRKSYIFPKNTQKFIITSQPYSKVRRYTPRPFFVTKKTLMPVFKPRITTTELVTISQIMKSTDSVVDWPTKVSKSGIHRKIVEEKHVNNYKGHNITEDEEIEKENQVKDDSDEISTGLPEFAEELSKEIDNNILVDFNKLSELDSERIKRFAVHSPISVHDSWYFKNVARVPIDNSHDDDDEGEFIFLENKPKKKPSNSVPSNKSSRSITSNKNNNKSPTTVHMSSRSKRSINVIEEEAHVTTESRFNIGHEPRLNSDLVFKNIHA